MVSSCVRPLFLLLTRQFALSSFRTTYYRNISYYIITLWRAEVKIKDFIFLLYFQALTCYNVVWRLIVRFLSFCLEIVRWTKFMRRFVLSCRIGLPIRSPSIMQSAIAKPHWKCRGTNCTFSASISWTTLAGGVTRKRRKFARFCGLAPRTKECPERGFSFIGKWISRYECLILIVGGVGYYVVWRNLYILLYLYPNSELNNYYGGSGGAE